RRRNVLGLQSLVAFADGEFDALTVVQDPVSLATNGAEVHEDVIATVPGNEAKTLAGVEPFDASAFPAGLVVGRPVFRTAVPCLALSGAHGDQSRRAKAGNECHKNDGCCSERKC